MIPDGAAILWRGIMIAGAQVRCLDFGELSRVVLLTFRFFVGFDASLQTRPACLGGSPV